MFSNIIRYYKERQQPIRAKLKLTKRCNFKCLHCYQLDRRTDNGNQDILGLPDWISLLKTLKENNVLFVRLTGGEPTLHPDFCDIYRAGAEIGLKLEVQTNGSLLNRQMIEIFTQHLPRVIRISLYGFSEESYEIFCENPKSFLVVLKNLEELRDEKIPVQVVVNVTDKNMQDVEKILEYCQENYLDATLHFSLSRLIDGAPLSRVSGINPLECLKYSDHWPLLAERIKKQFQLHGTYNTWKNDIKTCWAGSLSVYIDEKHNMFLCPIYRHNNISLKKVGFEIAWNRMKYLRKKSYSYSESMQ